MYNVILVDDDYPVLEFLHKKIPWNNLGFEVKFLGQDGMQALEYVEANGTDVIITDIGMPRMNGIELVENSRKIGTEIQFVFLTCHDEFAYAQQAIRLNAFDYILKETIDIDKITELLKRLKKKLDKEKNNHVEMNNMKYLIKENLTVLRSRLLEKLLKNDKEDTFNWLDKHKNELELDLSFHTCLPVICFIDDYEQKQDYFQSNSMLRFAIDNVLTETLIKETNRFFILYKDSMFFIFYTMAEDEKSISLEEIEQSQRDIKETLLKCLDISFTSIIGNVSGFPSALSEELIMLINSREQRFFMEHGTISKVTELSFEPENIFIHYTDVIQEFKLLVMQEDQEKLEGSVKRWMKQLKEKQYHPQAIKEWTLHILLDIERMIYSLNDFESRIESVDNDYILQSETIEQLKQMLLEDLLNKQNLLKSAQYLFNRPEIMDAQKYVLMNIDKKITLGNVAKHLHLNPSYFSRIYKQNTEENFIDFVNRTKMEKAKELIDNTNKPIEEIAYMLGFESKSYFLKIFKRYYDMTPKQLKYGS